MSNFSGKMKEYSFISIDRFNDSNLESSVYFLSHSHTDHTVGLDSPAFQYRMSSNSHFKLYCSQITRDILLLNNKYKVLEDSIVALEVNVTHTISPVDPQSGKEMDNIMVTLLPAEHCPGSVMFLFEGCEGTILYTGDFRLSKSELSQMKQLHSGSGPKEIYSLYVDTTFCVPQAMFIPDRDDSVQAIIDIIQEWISISEWHIVNIKHKAILGYENLFKKLSLHFNMKVHVHPNKYKMYERIGDMTEYTTPDPNNTQIHACRTKHRQGCSFLAEDCMPQGSSKIHLRSIAVSTMCFVQKVGLETYAKRFDETFFRVCYSFHPSYCEVRDLILYLQPKRAFANVIPAGETEDMIQQRLDYLVNLAKQSVRCISPSQHKTLGKLKVRKRKLSNQRLSQQSSESPNLDFGDIGDSPLQCKRHRVQDCSELDDNKTSDAKDSTRQACLTSKQNEIEANDNDTSGSAVGSGDESSAEDDANGDGNLVLQLSLSQDDSKALENFTPKLQDSYGSVLGFISEAGSDDGSDIEKLHLDENSQNQSLTQGRLEGSVPDLSQLLPNGDIKSPSNSDMSNHGATQLDKMSTDRVKSSQNSVSACGSSIRDDLVECDSTNSGKYSDVDSSFEEDVSDEHVHELADTPEATLKHGLASCKNTSMHSSDVILLEDDDHNNTVAGEVGSQQKACTSQDQQPSEMESSATEVCSQANKKSDENVIKENGKTTAQGPVTCTIDLTEMDEDDEVYPSTSTYEPRWYSYHGQNLFSRFSHSAFQQNPMGGMGMDVDDDIEYSEKEVACSDDECECGGKSKGGTHKYMVPRPKKFPNRLVPFQINWQIDSEGSDEDSLLELPAHVRTRKWIESQSLYMQRRHYLNSQVASSSEVIVIDSDDDEAEQNSSSSVPDEKNNSEKSDGCVDNANNKTENEKAKAENEDSNMTTKDKTQTTDSGDKNKQSADSDKNSKQHKQKDIKDGVNHERDSLSVDLSLTSCPTNLSMLAQASDMSQKSMNVNEIGELQKTVNGGNIDPLDSNATLPHRQAQLEDQSQSS